MFGSFRLGTLFGIPIGVNWTVLFIAWLIAFSLAAQLLPTQVPGLSNAVYWAAGGIAALLFFGSLLAHELSHALVARREGLTVSGITLWLLGGVARMEGEARSPGAEARIAGVGPLTSFALGVVFGVAAVAIGFAPASEGTALVGAAAAWLSLVNIVLAVFNLLPGAPLDGGRIARAIIWRVRRDKLQATRWATGLGQLFGYGMIGLGVLRFLAGDIGGIWFVLLGFFLSSAAGAERRSFEILESLRGIDVGSIMTRDPMRLPATLTVDTMAYAAMQEPRETNWLVTGPGGEVKGVLSLDQLRSVRGDARLTTRIGELATSLEQSQVAHPDEQVTEVIQRLQGTATRAVVRDRSWGGEILGLLTPEDIARALELGKLRGSQGGPAATPGSETSSGRAWP